MPCCASDRNGRTGEEANAAARDPRRVRIYPVTGSPSQDRGVARSPQATRDRVRQLTTTLCNYLASAGGQSAKSPQAMSDVLGASRWEGGSHPGLGTARGVIGTATQSLSASLLATAGDGSLLTDSGDTLRASPVGSRRSAFGPAP